MSGVRSPIRPGLANTPLRIISRYDVRAFRDVVESNIDNMKNIKYEKSGRQK
ncbi:MAG: hypothetical protein V3R36_03290 [Dehalococcoidales bacterium]